MAEPRHLKNAPIREAIIDFRIKAAEGFQVETFRQLSDRLKSEFPVCEERKELGGFFEINAGKAISGVKPEELNGYWFKSADGFNIAQFRRDGFTFNRLKPYTRWEEVFPKAWELWQLYAKTGAAEFVTRVAVRNVNRMSIINETYSTYLTSPPKIPEGIDGNMATFLSRVVINTADKITSNVTQALEKPVDSPHLAIILDIDTFKNEQFEMRDDSLRLIFSRLRDVKNNIFFKSITENAARSFE